MRSIVIGDVHGCYYTLMRLLDVLHYNEDQDHLYFLGDLVGKGNYSNKVMDFLLTLSNVNVVLGNNDVYWMYHYAVEKRPRDDFWMLDRSDHQDRWFNFFKQQEFLIEKDFGILVHASVSPDWTIEMAKAVNDRMVEQLRQKDIVPFLISLKGQPKPYHDDMNEIDRARTDFFILTQCRYYKDESFDLQSTDVPENIDATPWYSLDRKIKKPVLFGHWASLRGRSIPGVIALDGGAVYGGKLIAYIGETEEYVSVDMDDEDG